MFEIGEKYHTISKRRQELLLNKYIQFSRAIFIQSKCGRVFESGRSIWLSLPQQKRLKAHLC